MCFWILHHSESRWHNYNSHLGFSAAPWLIRVFGLYTPVGKSIDGWHNYNTPQKMGRLRYGGHDKPRLMGVASHLLSLWSYNENWAVVSNIFCFHLYLGGRWTHFDDHSFWMGWFNHQWFVLDYIMEKVFTASWEPWVWGGVTLSNHSLSCFFSVGGAVFLYSTLNLTIDFKLNINLMIYGHQKKMNRSIFMQQFLLPESSKYILRFGLFGGLFFGVQSYLLKGWLDVHPWRFKMEHHESWRLGF